MNIKEQIRAFVAENLMFSANGFDLDDSASLLEEGGIDSTGVLELVFFVEAAFGIQVEDDDIVPANFDSVNRLNAFIQRRLG